MLISTILVAALLFCLAVIILANACRPFVRRQLDNDAPATQELSPFPLEHKRAPDASDDLMSTLSDEERDGFCQVWHSVRERFDIEPTVTVMQADLLMSDLMDDFQGAARRTNRELGVLSERKVKQQYWSAHEIAIRSKEGWAQQCELEQAMGLYTVLFDELLGTGENPPVLQDDLGPVTAQQESGIDSER